MTTDLLPFDLETALREPERVRDERGTAAVQVAHFPKARPGFRIAVLFGDNDRPQFFREEGRPGHSDSYSLFLAPKTRKVWVRIMGRGDGEFDTHISLHPACEEALPVGWRWLDAGPTEIEIREDA